MEGNESLVLSFSTFTSASEELEVLAYLAHTSTPGHTAARAPLKTNVTVLPLWFCMLEFVIAGSAPTL